eukprot:2268842-Pyramimonas_sp.AAC.1
MHASTIFYEDLRARWKAARAVGPETKRSNGFIQGDSWSLQQALALMSIWSHALEKEAEVKVASFIDDGNFRAEGPQHAIRTAKATTISVEFDQHS